MSSFTRIQLESWLKKIDIPDNVIILDVGGAQQSILGRVNKVGKNSKCEILDLALPHEIKEKVDIVHDLNLPFKKELKKEFDIAFCLEVSEYWWNPVQALKNINNLLKKDGILYVSFHFLYMSHPPLGCDFLRYTPFGAEKLLKETGFKIISNVNRVTESPLLQMFYENDKMRGLKSNLINHNVTGSLIKVQKM